MSTESDAKKAVILDMLDGWEASNRLSPANLGAYYREAEEVSLDSLRKVCRLFASGRAPNHDPAFMPTAAEIAARARMFDEMIATVAADQMIENLVVYKIGEKPPPGMQSLGEFEEARRKHTEAMRDKITIPQLRKMVEKKQKK